VPTFKHALGLQLPELWGLYARLRIDHRLAIPSVTADPGALIVPHTRSKSSAVCHIRPTGKKVRALDSTSIEFCSSKRKHTSPGIALLAERPGGWLSICYAKLNSDLPIWLSWKALLTCQASPLQGRSGLAHLYWRMSEDGLNRETRLRRKLK
jgi:hypothetical protein